MKDNLISSSIPLVKADVPTVLSQYKHFFEDQNPPDLVKDYDVIGFDLENCLVKFNPEYRDHTVKAILTQLVNNYQQAYLPSLLSFEYLKHKDCQISNALWDIDNGFILQLTKDT